MRTPTPEIRQAFYGHLLANLPCLCITENDVAWPNVKFQPKPDRYYIAPYCLFSESRIASLSEHGFEEISGIFQISIYGIRGEGEGLSDALAQRFTDLFRGGKFIALSCYEPIAIRKTWRSQLYFEANGRGAGRPWLTVSASWHQYTAKGE